MKIFSHIKRYIAIIFIIFNILVMTATIFSGYGGHISPLSMPFAGVMVMTFPLWIIINVILLILYLIFWRIMSLFPAITLLICISPILNICPLNFGNKNIAECRNEKKSFTLLTYNVLDFIDYRNKYPENSNRTLDYIISADADIVCMQECEYLSPLKRFHVYAHQIDLLKSRYPYRKIDIKGQSIISKYPFEYQDSAYCDFGWGGITAFKININNNDVLIFNIHLQSIGLSDDDKQLYRELTHLKTENNIKRAKRQLLDKLFDAFKGRAEQINMLHSFIEKSDIKNIIVCGDFNDTPGSYAINTIIEEGFKDAYCNCGLGPTATYNANGFAFRIDHILYKGNINATAIERGDVDSSDHYPLMAVFQFE